MGELGWKAPRLGTGARYYGVPTRLLWWVGIALAAIMLNMVGVALAHDTGLGTPAERAARAGIDARVLGENVAHALDAERAHRTLWASPSHRKNLLDPRFDALGLGVAVDSDDGSLWVSEIFARLHD